jgi:hypothetical protein
MESSNVMLIKLFFQLWVCFCQTTHNLLDQVTYPIQLVLQLQIQVTNKLQLMIPIIKSVIPFRQVEGRM